MANKARYYGLVTKEQEELRKRAFRSPVINKEELTQYSLYSAMAKIENVDNFSATFVAGRIKDIIMKSDFKGTITVNGVVISDGANTYTLTKNIHKGIHIIKSEYDETKRKR